MSRRGRSPRRTNGCTTDHRPSDETVTPQLATWRRRPSRLTSSPRSVAVVAAAATTRTSKLYKWYYFARTHTLGTNVAASVIGGRVVVNATSRNDSRRRFPPHRNSRWPVCMGGGAQLNTWGKRPHRVVPYSCTCCEHIIIYYYYIEINID